MFTELKNCPFGNPGNGPETGFETISLQLNDHSDCGLGGRQYGASEDIETLQSKNNASTSRLGAVEECGSSLTRCSEFARIIRSCHRRIYRVVLSYGRFFKSAALDPLKDFIPVAALTSQPYVLVTGKSSGITTLGELLPRQLPQKVWWLLAQALSAWKLPHRYVPVESL